MTLGVPPLTQRAAGSRVTAATYEQDITDSVGFLAQPPVFLGIQSAVQSTATGGWTTLTFDTFVVDSYNGHSNSVNNSRYTAQVAGYYMVCGSASFVSNSTGSRGARASLNGSIINGSGQLVGAGTLNCAVNSALRPVFLNVGDYVEISAGQNSGGALNTMNSGESMCSMTIWWLHE